MPRAALEEFEVGATSSTTSLTTIVRKAVMLVSCRVRELQEQYEDLRHFRFIEEFIYRLPRKNNTKQEVSATGPTDICSSSPMKLSSEVARAVEEIAKPQFKRKFMKLYSNNNLAW